LALVKSADVFLQASLWEGMSFALLEAMALGRICVVSNAVGNRDLIEDRVTGFVCDNTETYATVLRRVAADSDSAVRMGEAAQQHVAEHCDLNVLLSRWAELYVDVLAQNNANRRFDLRGIANKSAPARPT
jgi:glycosyltransferase involved in cell wall biosynthesis